MQSNTQDIYIDHEVRIQLLEKIASRLEAKFDHMESKMEQRFNFIENKLDSHFKWTLGTVIGMILTIVTLFGGVILAKMV